MKKPLYRVWSCLFLCLFIPFQDARAMCVEDTLLLDECTIWPNNFDALFPKSKTRSLENLELPPILCRRLFHFLLHEFNLSDRGLETLDAISELILSEIHPVQPEQIALPVPHSTTSVPSLLRICSSFVAFSIPPGCAPHPAQSIRDYAELRINLSRNNIRVLPFDFYLLTNLISIDLSNNNLETFSLEGLSNLTCLDLSSNRLLAVPSDITIASCLEKVSFSNNRLIKVSSVLLSLNNLKKLDLSFNAIKEIEWQNSGSNSKAVLCSLESLDLNHNALQELPRALFLITTLRKLNLSHNLLAEIPTQIENLCHLNELTLSQNLLQDLPHCSIFTAIRSDSFQTARLLELSSNRFQNLPLILCTFTQLGVLHLNNNKLTQLPPEIGNLVSLSFLVLSFNRLEELPSSIGNLTNLNTLELNDNNLRQVPSSIGNLTKLQTLLLHNNKIIFLPTEITKAVIVSDVQPSLLSELFSDNEEDNKDVNIMLDIRNNNLAPQINDSNQQTPLVSLNQIEDQVIREHLIKLHSKGCLRYGDYTGYLLILKRDIIDLINKYIDF